MPFGRLHTLNALGPCHKRACPKARPDRRGEGGSAMGAGQTPSEAATAAGKQETIAKGESPRHA